MSGYLIGMAGKKPVHVDIESSGLVLAPARSGKTACLVIPWLMGNPENMIVLDQKDTLRHITAEYRRKKFGHKIVVIDFSGNSESACYNPMQLLIDDWRDSRFHSRLVPDTQALARQLYPVAPNTHSDPFWGNGTRKYLSFGLLYNTTMSADPTLTNTLILLSDMTRFENALRMAATTPHLSGDLALSALDILSKIDKGGDPKQLDSFREGATQALQSYRPSSIAAKVTSRSDITADDLRNGKVTVYIIGDPANSAAIAPCIGCASWSLITGLMRARTGTGKSIAFIGDEITNCKIENLPSWLTILREFKIKLWLIVQEQEEWAKVYGRESLETLLSQTEVKIFFNSTSDKTCQLVSNMLGEQTVKSRNYNLGAGFFDEVTSSISDAPRRLMTPDEVRRTEDMIVFVRNHRPMRLSKIGYHEIEPYASKSGINPLFGTRYKGKIRLRL